MKLWLFIPSEAWNYCGGVVAAIAPTFEEAAAIICAAEERDGGSNPRDRMQFFATEPEREQWHEYDRWVLHSAIETTETTPRFVVSDYNWA